MAGLVLGYLQIILAAIAIVVVGCVLVWGYSLARDVEVRAATVTNAVSTTAPGVAGAGVKMVNEMDQADFKLLADAGVPSDPSEIIAFYGAGGPANRPEFALVTKEAVVYLKDGSKTSFDLADVVDLKDDAAFEGAYLTGKDASGQDHATLDPEVYHIEVRDKGGSRMRIRIRPELAGASFFEALKSAVEAQCGSTGTAARAKAA